VASRTEQPRRRLSAEQRRTAILDAALVVFSARGYHASSIDEIAQAAGISKALIYEHFPSKRDLHVSLLERHVQEIVERLAASADTPEPGEVRLRAGVDAFLAYVEERRDAFHLLFRDALEADVAEVLTRMQLQATLAIADLIASEPVPRDARETPAERKRNIEMLAQQLSGAVQSLAIWWEAHPDIPRSRLVDSVMAFAWVGLGGLRSGTRAAS
jgi:AcrR family transcriptional regulator